MYAEKDPEWADSAIKNTFHHGSTRAPSDDEYCSGGRGSFLIVQRDYNGLQHWPHTNDIGRARILVWNFGIGKHFPELTAQRVEAD